MYVLFSSVQFSRSVMSDSLRPHESQHARPPCPSLTPGVHPNSCASSRWCHPAISSSVIPFSSCPQSLPASVFSNESTLHMMWPKYWSFSLSISPSNEHPGLVFFRNIYAVCIWKWRAHLWGGLKEINTAAKQGSRAEERHTLTAFEVLFCLCCPFSDHLNHTTVGHVSVGMWLPAPP